MAKLKVVTCCLLILFIFLLLLDLATFGVLIGVGKSSYIIDKVSVAVSPLS